MAWSAKSNYRSRPDPPTTTDAVAGPLSGARVLVVDDEFLIAAQLKSDLREAGAEVVGPSITLKEAVALAKRERLSAAILDIHLGPDDVGPVAQELSGRGIPFLFYTGQVRTDPIRAQWPTSQVVSKPATAASLIAAIARLLK